MKHDTVRIGIVGAGGNTKSRHIPGLLAQDDIVISAVCNRSRESAANVAAEFGIETVRDSWEEIVQDADIDAVVIGTWPYMHCPVSVAALESGKHVMCEARMAMNASEARQMLAAARRHPELTAQIVPSPFTLHVDGTIQRLLADGTLGELMTIDIFDHGKGFPEPDGGVLHWRHERSKSGLNIQSLGIWYEALMRWAGEATHVLAHGRVFSPQKRDIAIGTLVTTDIPDYIEVSARMACGAEARFSIRSAGGLVPRREAVLTGTDGTLRFDGRELSAGGREDGELQIVEPRPGEAKGWRVEEEFVNSIRGLEKIQLTTFEDGLKYMAFTEAVHDSLKQGRVIAVAEYL